MEIFEVLIKHAIYHIKTFHKLYESVDLDSNYSILMFWLHSSNTFSVILVSATVFMSRPLLWQFNCFLAYQFFYFESNYHKTCLLSQIGVIFCRRIYTNTVHLSVQDFSSKTIWLHLTWINICNSHCDILISKLRVTSYFYRTSCIRVMSYCLLHELRATF